MTTMITEKNFALEISQKMQEKTLNIASKLPFPIKKGEMEGTCIQGTNSPNLKACFGGLRS